MKKMYALSTQQHHGWSAYLVRCCGTTASPSFHFHCPDFTHTNSTVWYNKLCT